MYLGKPVIATNWSGNTDYMTPRNSCPVDYDIIEIDRDHGPYARGQKWADPDIEHAARHMRSLVEDPALDGVSGRYFDQLEEGTAEAQAYDAGARRRLWELSEELTGERFDL